MKTATLLAAGFAVGFLFALRGRQSSSCCARVEAAVREKVGDKLGGTAQAIGDLVGWGWTPGALDFFGVDP